jgi:ABC-type uncharacterized transport system substrate-binding protein
MKRVATPAILAAVMLLGVAVIAVAQQQTKVTKIGWLAASRGRLLQFDNHKKALRALGYIEGKNIAFEYRSAEGETGRFPALADELVRLKVDLIVANATTAALAAKNATRTIPIVFTSGGDPVAVGLIDSLARPGGNLKEAVQARSTALLVTLSGVNNSNHKRIAALTLKYRLPAISRFGDFVASGGLMSYGNDAAENYKRVAYLIDKILKGAKPADLPVERPTKFEFVINLKTAKQIGLTIPPNVLARADRVIK